MIESNQNRGIFLMKNNRINQLKCQNQILEAEIQKLISEHHQKLKENTDLTDKRSSLKDKIQLNTQAVKDLLDTIQTKKKQSQCIKQEEEQSVNLFKKLQKQTQELQKQLSQLIDVENDQQILLKRYKNELKETKRIGSSKNSMVSISDNIKKQKDYEIKNYNLLLNKLEGKKKYLSILDKKVAKIKKQEQDKKKNKHGVKKDLYDLTNLGKSTKYFSRQFQQVSLSPKVNKQIQNAKVKEMNIAIRKKNLILSHKN